MTTTLPLNGWKIAIPESRQLDVLTNMLDVRGAHVTRCPLVAIHDSPNEADIKHWLIDFCAGKYDDLVILTGEGIRRLSGFAERFDMTPQWQTALQNVRKIARGPKPASALRVFSTKPDLLGTAPTTEGVIATLDTLDLSGRHVAVQLYGEEPNTILQNYLKNKHIHYTIVAPYIYASDTETKKVEDFLRILINQDVDAMVFTSVVQVKRLKNVAKGLDCEQKLWDALNGLCVVSVGPVITELLATYGVDVKVMPDEKFFMKPMVRKLVKYIEENPKTST